MMPIKLLGGRAGWGGWNGSKNLIDDGGGGGSDDARCENDGGGWYVKVKSVNPKISLVHKCTCTYYRKKILSQLQKKLVPNQEKY